MAQAPEGPIDSLQNSYAEGLLKDSSGRVEEGYFFNIVPGSENHENPKCQKQLGA
jgi:hypothetical protein